eukprot:scaffold138701_cov127-Phaeocystis_antarctica.AAC.1
MATPRAATPIVSPSCTGHTVLRGHVSLSLQRVWQDSTAGLSDAPPLLLRSRPHRRRRRQPGREVMLVRPAPNG